MLFIAARGRQPSVSAVLVRLRRSLALAAIATHCGGIFAAISFFNPTITSAAPDQNRALEGIRAQSLPWCKLVNGGVGELCATQLAMFRDSGKTISRIRIQASHMAKPINEYLVWYECGGKNFRVLSREPAHLNARQRWLETQASTATETDRVLRVFGEWACTEPA